MKGNSLSDFLDWWQALSPWIRYPIATGIIAGSAYWFAHPLEGLPHSGKLFGLLFAIGFILLAFGESE
jgi:hypothetical protein